MIFLLGLALSLAYIPGITGNALPTGWAVLSLVLPLTLWKKADMTLFHWLGALFLIYAAISSLWAPEPWDAVWRLWQFGILALGFRLGATSIDLKPLWKGLAVGVGISSFVAVMQHSGYNWLPHATPYPGIYYNGVASGAITALTIVALCSNGLWVWSAPLFPGLILSGSRAGIAATALGLLLCLHRQAWIALVPIIAAFAVTLHLGNSDIQRFNLWFAVASHLEFLGNGAGSIMSLFFTTPSGLQHPQFAHNDYLELLFEFGAGCLFLLPWAFVYAQSWHPLFPIPLTFLLLALVAMPLGIPVAAFIFAVASGRIAGDWHRAFFFSDLRGSYLSNRPRFIEPTVLS